MTPDETVPDPAQATEQVAGEARDAVEASAGKAAEQLAGATTAVADGAEAANRQGAAAATEASRMASEAFGAARERLNAMSGPTPGLFQADGGTFGKGMQASYATAIEGMAEFNSKAIAAWRTNAESTIRHWQSLVGVRNLSEVIAMSAEHTRQQLEAVTAQTRELSALATRIARDATDPLKLTGR